MWLMELLLFIGPVNKIEIFRRTFFNCRDLPVFVFGLNWCENCENMTFQASVQKLIVNLYLFFFSSERFCGRGVVQTFQLKL
jgi:hypothetical protein